MEAQEILDRLLANGWRVFTEHWPEIDGPVKESAIVWVGATRSTGIGIEGVSYCDYRANAPTLVEALRLLEGRLP